MNELSAIHICDEITISLQTTRLTLQSSKTSDVRDAFWRLQDLLHLLSAFAGDKTSEVVPLLKSNYPSLVRDTIELLRWVSHLGYSRIEAVAQSCNAINSYLIVLEQIKQQHRARAAGH